MNKKLASLLLILPFLNSQIFADTKKSAAKKKPSAKIFDKKSVHRKIKGMPQEDFQSNQNVAANAHSSEKNPHASSLLLPTALKNKPSGKQSEASPYAQNTSKKPIAFAQQKTPQQTIQIDAQPNTPAMRFYQQQPEQKVSSKKFRNQKQK